MSDTADDVEPSTVVDGGDKACGELLLVLARQLRAMAPGSTIRLVATDPAAVLDVPAWCYLTGHHYLGHGQRADGRPHYDLKTSNSPRLTHGRDPWRVTTTSSSTPSHSQDTSL